jgi:hypothetical protein
VERVACRKILAVEEHIVFLGCERQTDLLGKRPILGRVAEENLQSSAIVSGTSFGARVRRALGAFDFAAASRKVRAPRPVILLPCDVRPSRCRVSLRLEGRARERGLGHASSKNTWNYFLFFTHFH